MARRRFGLLDRGLLAPQCHFLAGVYLMYTMQPLSAWSHFHSASRSYHIYLQCQARRPARVLDASKASRRRRLEQRLYWSCYKSECELRTEMDLPSSSLVDFHYPDMHPSPPDIDAPTPSSVDESSLADGSVRSAGARRTLASSVNQEESWFYYLTEITLRRIANRIFNTFYVDPHTSWNDETIHLMARAVEDFEQQLEEWYIPQHKLNLTPR